MITLYQILNKFVRLFSQRFLSKWTILIIDLSIVFLTSLLTYFFIFSFNIELLLTYFFLNQGIIILSSLVGFVATSSYCGIIRHTGGIDSAKIIFAMLIAIIQIGIIYIFSSNIPILENRITFTPNLVILFFLLSCIFLISFRFGVRFIFFTFSNNISQKKNILVYGAGNAGRMMNAIVKNHTNANYNIVGYIDDHKQIQGKYIDGVKIYKPDLIDNKLIKQLKVDEIIFSIYNISIKRKSEILEGLLQLDNVKIKEPAAIENWIENKLGSTSFRDININDVLHRDEISLDFSIIELEIKDKVVMITGGAGSIGSEIVRQVIKFSPKQVIVLDQAETPMYNIEQELIKSNSENFSKIHFQIANIRNASSIDRIFSIYKPNIVFHAAAYKHVPMMEINPFSAVETNIFGTRNIASYAANYGCEKFVMISTDKAVRPTNIMGASKRIAEILCQGLNNKEGNTTKFITTRFGNVLGSNGSVVSIFEKQIKSGGPVTVTHKDVTRYFMTIPEACQLVLQAGAMGNGGEIYLFEMGKAVRINDLAEKMIRLMGYVPYKDINIEYVGLRPGEKIHEELLLEDENSLPTTNQKIKIAKINKYSYNEIAATIAQLEEAYLSYDTDKLVKMMKTIVPEYISNNSVFSKLDK